MNICLNQNTVKKIGETFTDNTGSYSINYLAIRSLSNGIFAVAN